MSANKEKSPVARRSLGEGGKAPRKVVRRGAVETPPVQSVERALSVLEAVAQSAEPVPLARLTEVLGIDPSSVFRLANTLKRRGFLANPNGRKHYVLGPAVWQLSVNNDWSRILITSGAAVRALAPVWRKPRSLRPRRTRRPFHDPRLRRTGASSGLPSSDSAHCTGHGKALLADFGCLVKARYGRLRSSATPPNQRFAAVMARRAPVRARLSHRRRLLPVGLRACGAGPRSGLTRTGRSASCARHRLSAGRDRAGAARCDAAAHINALLGCLVACYFV